MRREKRQNRIREEKKIQKEICRIALILLMILNVLCTVGLTGCRDKKSEEQTELISLDGRDTDMEKTDKNPEQGAGKADAGTGDTGAGQSASTQNRQKNKQEKLQICYVHVCGAVKSPGVYELTADSRLFEAIQMAGGLTEEAAGEAVNQAELVEDGSRIYVPTKEEAGATMADDGTFVQGTENGKTSGENGTEAGDPSDGRVNINTAAKDELMTLSGIGEAKAEAIIRYREEHGAFQKPEDLMEVEGIKEGVFQKVKDQIKV